MNESTLRSNGFLPTREASTRMGVHRRTLDRWFHEGRVAKAYDERNRAYYGRLGLSSNEMAARLGVTMATVRRMGQRGELAITILPSGQLRYTEFI